MAFSVGTSTSPSTSTCPSWRVWTSAVNGARKSGKPFGMAAGWSKLFIHPNHDEVKKLHDILSLSSSPDEASFASLPAKEKDKDQDQLK